MPPTIIFDFDGTIANTFEVMFAIYNKIAPFYHCPTIGPEDREYLRNHSVRESMAAYHMPAWKLPFLGIAIKKRLRAQIENTEPQPGTIEAINALRHAGCTLGIVSSNSKENIYAFLTKYNLENAFSFVVPYRHIFGKHRALRTVIKTSGLEPETTFYVGDEVRDVEAAKTPGKA